TNTRASPSREILTFGRGNPRADSASRPGLPTLAGLLRLVFLVPPEASLERLPIDEVVVAALAIRHAGVAPSRHTPATHIGTRRVRTPSHQAVGLGPTDVGSIGERRRRAYQNSGNEDGDRDCHMARMCGKVTATDAR